MLFFLKVLETLDKMYNSALVQIHAKWEWNITEVWLFCFAPSKIYPYKFFKAFQQNTLRKNKFILWFFELKTFKDDSFLQNENLVMKKFPETMFCYFWKFRSQSNDFLSPIPYFCDKSKGYVD